MIFKRTQPPYSQADVSAHNSLINDLYKQRDKQFQLIALNRNERNQEQLDWHKQELDTIDRNIQTANLSLGYILEMNENWLVDRKPQREALR